MAKRTTGSKWQATETLLLPNRRTITAGDILDASDSALDGREHLFTNLNPDIEEATAEPGKKRRTRSEAAAAAPVEEELDAEE